MSFTHWESIKIGADGLELQRRVEQVEASVNRTAAAVNRVEGHVRQTAEVTIEVAAQSQRASDAIADTNRQLITLARSLERTKAISPPIAKELQPIKPMTRIDPAKLKDLENVAKKPN